MVHEESLLPQPGIIPFTGDVCSYCSIIMTECNMSSEWLRLAVCLSGNLSGPLLWCMFGACMLGIYQSVCHGITW